MPLVEPVTTAVLPLRDMALSVGLLRQIDRSEQERRQFVLLRLHRGCVVLAILMRLVGALALGLRLVVVAPRLLVLLLAMRLVVVRAFGARRLRRNGHVSRNGRRLDRPRRFHP